MAYVKDKGKILDKMRELNAVCYTISGVGGKPIHSQNEDMDLPLDRALDLMQDDLDSFEGTVEVTLREVSKAKRNQGGITRSNHVYLIRLGSSESHGSGGNNANMFTLMMQLQQAKIEAIDAKYRHLEEVRLLKEKKKSESAMDKYMPMLVPYFPHILNKMGIPTPVHGFPELAAPQEVNTETEFMANTLTPQDIARINAAVARLQKLDPDFINNLEALANYAEKNIAQYNMVLPMIRGVS